MPYGRHLRRIGHGRRLERKIFPTAVPYRYRSPGLAALMSFFIPGLGQVYNGHYLKGIIIFFTSFLVIPYIYGIGDAYFSAKRISYYHDRYTFQRLLVYQEKAPPPVPSSFPVAAVEKPAAPSKSPPVAVTDTEYQENLWEKRFLVGGAIFGAGAFLEVLALTVGGGVALGVVGSFPLVLGGALGVWSWKKQKEWRQKKEKEQEVRLERIVVSIAKTTGGVLSVADLVAKTELGMAEAEEILNRFVIKGYADIQVTDDGLMEYYFALH